MGGKESCMFMLDSDACTSFLESQNEEDKYKIVKELCNDEFFEKRCLGKKNFAKYGGGSKDAEVISYCETHGDDPFCSCITEAKKADAFEDPVVKSIIKKVNCYNPTCAQEGYKTIDMVDSICPNSLNLCLNAITIDGTVVGVASASQKCEQDIVKENTEKISTNVVVSSPSKKDREPMFSLMTGIYLFGISMIVLIISVIMVRMYFLTLTKKPISSTI